MNSKDNFKMIGEYKFYSNCRFCNSILTSVINLGFLPLAGGFLKTKNQFNKEKLYPLALGFCQNCKLLQTMQVVSADKLFKNYFYFSSKINTLTKHFNYMANHFNDLGKHPTKKIVVEIGSNDGAFLKACLNLGIQAVGVDPATNVVRPLLKELPIINEYFTTKTAKTIVKKYGHADIIFSSNTLAHIEDMHEVYKGINFLLKDDGMLVFENHYLGNLISQMQYDMIYHEHQYYYSLNALVNYLAQFNMEIFDVKFIPIHAGSISVYVQKKGSGRKVKKIVLDTLKIEKKVGLTSIKTFTNYNKRIAKSKVELIKLLTSLKKKGKTIAGYGASGRGTILMSYCGIDKTFIDYVIDDAPAKQGAYTPGNHLLIRPSDALKEKNRPDYVLLFAWSFYKEIEEKNKDYIKNGGKFIIPLPKVKIV